MFTFTNANKMLASTLLGAHFGRLALANLVTASRTFPMTSRVDLQLGLNRIFADRFKARLVGVHASQFSLESLTTAHQIGEGPQAVQIGPLQYDEIDVGDLLPARCLKNCLWLSKNNGVLFAVLLTLAERMGQSEGVRIEITTPPGEAGLEFSRTFFDEVDRLVNLAASYRGKVISLKQNRYGYGPAGGVKVHKLQSVPRAEVILPEKTLRLLERNVGDFIQQRDRLKGLGMAIKKGLLFYGPPGTGKTHTIQYLASQLPNHTTLLVTAEQVGLLDQYVQLARFLQPVMVVIEDVDLIARAREQIRGGSEESMLNMLLNEMDGLREDAAILFVLTTNRPEQLETALSSRPGRIDQAIEFPLPDDEGREKLVRLYARKLAISDEVVAIIVKKTKTASAAFIKELMRRCAQYHLQSQGTGSLSMAHVEAALDEMLFSGGSLNIKLLGGGALGFAPLPLGG